MSYVDGYPLTTVDENTGESRLINVARSIP